MRRVLWALLVGALLISVDGCQWVIAVRTIPVSGVVRYPNGVPAPVSKVWTDSGVSAWADSEGRYQILIAVSTGAVTLRACDGYEPGKAYAVTHSGSASVKTTGTAQSLDIVLDHSSPI